MTNEQYNMFSGVFIPREVLLDAEISASCKIIYAIIQSLDNADGCYASNDYIGKMLDLSERSVSDAVSALVDKQYVTRFVDNDKGIRVLHTISSRALAQKKTATPPSEKLLPPTQKTATNKTKNNNRRINTGDTKTLVLPPLPHGQALWDAWDKWVAYKKERNTPLTNSTVLSTITFLTQLNEHDAILSIELSIRNGWSGLFAPQQSKWKQASQSKPLTKSDHESF